MSEDAPPVRALAPRGLDEPSASRLSPRHPFREEILERHAEALDAGRLSYTDPETGYLVFTAKFLADRGFCCDSGCRHCPYVVGGDDT